MTAKKTAKQTTAEKEEALKKILEAVKRETADIKDDIEDIKEDLEKKEHPTSKKELNISVKEELSEVEGVDEVEEDPEEISVEEEAPVREKDVRGSEDESKTDIEEEKVDVSEKADEIETEESQEKVVENVEDGESDFESGIEEENDTKEEEKVPAFGPVNYEKSQNSLLWKFIYLVAFFVGVGGAIVLYQNFNPQGGQEETVEVISPTVTPAPTVSLEIGDYPITVQNGAGVAGVAGSARDLLEDEGFTVDDTGNADNYDYEETEIHVGVDVPDEVIDTLREVLAAEYVVADGTQDYGTDGEILVIIGSETN